ncbi:MAG: membrane protein insertase YidC [Cyanobacteriota/Melainabacteria group bacterium]
MDLTYSFMIPLLENLVQATHSYGWAIVALTVIVRLLLWPLMTKQTESMQKMSQISPIMKQIQERYKDDPELLQKKLAELMMKNKANPVGGCLPMLIQLPIFLALFATFSGPPFGDKPIDVHVKVKEGTGIERKVTKETSGGELPYVGKDGELAKVCVFPGEITIGEGQEVDFGSRAVDGKLAPDYAPTWAVFKDNKKVEDSIATIDEKTGHAVFSKAGDYKVVATVHGVAKEDSFLFINGLGKVETGVKLLKPENFDALILIVGFGITMALSSKLNQGTMAKKDEPMDENQRVMQDTMKFMPVVLTGTFFFIPLPVGVLLYMVVSNIIQTFQTWILMRKPAPAIINVMDDDEPTPPAGKKRKKSEAAAKTSNNGSKTQDDNVVSLTKKKEANSLKIAEEGAEKEATISTANSSSEKKRNRKKKKK